MMDATDRRIAGTLLILAALIATGVLLSGVVLGVAVRIFTLLAWG